jgi:hypothetical protein
MKVYTGLKEKTKPEIFEVEDKPTKETYLRYNIIYGLLKSKEDAERYIKAMGDLAC